MAIVKVLDVSTEKLVPGVIKKGVLDQPKTGSESEVFSVELSGWVLGSDQPVRSVAIFHGDNLLKKAPVNLARPVVASRYPAIPHAALCGFRTEIGVVGLPLNCPLQIQAVMQNAEVLPFAEITLKHEPLRADYEPKLNPLMVTSLGRSGTTWTLRLLGEHPEIVIHRVHPYETMAASYWMHQLKVLTDPANHLQSTRRLGFFDRGWNIGQNPYFTRPVTSHENLKYDLGNTYIRRFADFTLRTIDDFYTSLAEGQKDPQPRFFGEKTRANHITRMHWELYPGAKEIFLIRDFRDMVCSMFSFNEKRGYVGVGPLNAKNDADFIRQLRPRLELLLETQEARADRTFLLHYEDLILDRETALKNTLEYLGLDSEQGTIRQMVRDASKEPATQTLARKLISTVVPNRFKTKGSAVKHQTASDPSRSIGRWKRDLSPELQAVCDEAFGDLLEEAGYERGG